jgi:hypothetical protein
MLTRKKLEEKLDKSNKVCIVTVCVLPGGAVETLVNYQNLHEKRNYLLNAYDDNLTLKTMPEIKLLDCIVISESDI